MKNISYSYSPAIESKEIRGHDEERPWNILEIIRQYSHRDKILIDIGCGTAFKTIQLSHHFSLLVGLEPNAALLESAKKNIENSCVSNCILAQGVVDEIPFADNSIDVVMSTLAPHNAKETARILKKNGYAILEKIGGNDKANIKDIFGLDELGWRGYLHHEKKCVSEQYRDDFSHFFKTVSIEDGFWKTYYSKDQLIKLLEETPTIRDFNKVKDEEKIQEVEQRYLTKHGIETTQHRLLIVAQK